jgi:hypothetical protein
LTDPTDRTDPSTDEREPEFGSAAERRDVGRQLAKAARGVEAMRTFLWFCAVGCFLWALGAAGLWSIPGGVLTVVCVGGALNVRKKPALCAVMLAVALTPLGLVFLGIGLYAIDIRAIIGGIVMIGGAWGSVGVMRRAERLMEAHPDHFGARRIRGEPRRKKR